MIALVFEAVGHVALDDSQGEAFGDGGFADAGFADEDRVVFSAAGEDLDDAADFLIAADDGIELALAGALDQVDAVFLQGLEFSFGGLVGDAGRAADGFHGLEELLFGDGVELEDVTGFGIDFGQGEQEVFGGDEVVFHGAGFALGGFEDLAEGLADAGMAFGAADFGEMAEFGFDDAIELGAVDADFFQERLDDAFVFAEQRGQQVEGVDLLLAVVGGEFLARWTAS